MTTSFRYPLWWEPIQTGWSRRTVSPEPRRHSCWTDPERSYFAISVFLRARRESLKPRSECSWTWSLFLRRREGRLAGPQGRVPDVLQRESK